MALELGIEAAIHARWAAVPALVALVPAARLFTGCAVGEPAMPYVVLRRTRTGPLARTSSGRQIIRTRVRVEVWSTGLAEAKQVAQAVSEEFERGTLTLAAGTCLTIQHAGHEEAINPQGIWSSTTEYDVLHESGI